ncbi:MAG: Spy/CpxP family protein refolding chaperone [Thiobacillaceae bacterium]
MKLINGSFTKHALLVGLLAGTGILAAPAFAMPDGGSGSKRSCEARHGQEVHARWEAHRAGRLSALKEKLKLKPQQEAAWNAFAGASQPVERHMGEEKQARRGEFAKLNTPQRLDIMLAKSDQRRTRMVERTQAIKTFYAQLTPEQQRVFDAEAMPNRHRGEHRHHHQS